VDTEEILKWASCQTSQDALVVSKLHDCENDRQGSVRLSMEETVEGIVIGRPISFWLGDPALCQFANL